MLFLILGAERSSPTNPEPELPDISARINAFTLALLRQHAATGDPPANAVLSAQSIFHGLAMTYVASGTDTRKELAEVLGFPDDNEQLLRDLACLRRQLQTARQPGHMEVSVANSVWLDETFADFRKEYVQEVQEAFEASLQRLKFRQAVHASAQIDRWIAERTRGKITGSIGPGDLRSYSGPGVIDELALISVNAVYFQADWGSRFDKNATGLHAFHVDATTTVDSLMMHQCSLLPYAEDDRFKFLELPYINRDYSMYIVLPRGIIPLAELIDRMTTARVTDLQHAAGPYQVDVLLPRFTMRSHLDVKDILVAMGVHSVFDKQKADLDKMILKKDEAFRIYLAEISQDVWTDVHEEGTQAAAATVAEHYSIGCSVLRPSVVPSAQFHADHPFLFLVVHKKSHSILFAGWISDPEKIKQSMRPDAKDFRCRWP
jgi:serpin B